MESEDHSGRQRRLRRNHVPASHLRGNNRQIIKPWTTSASRKPNDVLSTSVESRNKSDRGDRAAANECLIKSSVVPVCDSADDSLRLWTPTNSPYSFQDEADLYVKEFIKVEAFISPKIRKQFLIPINIPCAESSSRNIKTEETRTRLDPDNVGKLKLRNIAELQQPPVREDLAPPPQANLNIPPPCFCYHCIPSYHNKYIPARPRPQFHAIPRPPQVWRPF